MYDVNMYWMLALLIVGLISNALLDGFIWGRHPRELPGKHLAIGLARVLYRVHVHMKRREMEAGNA